MFKRYLAAVALVASASSAWGYNLTVSPTAVQEPDGPQSLVIEFVHEQGDLAGTCAVDVTAAAQPLAQPSVLDATPNEDYTPTTQQFTLVVSSDGPTDSGTFTAEILDDALAEPREEFALDITVVENACAGGDLTGLDNEFAITIFDDDPGAVSVSVDQTNVVVNEGAGTVDVPVSLAGIETTDGDFIAYVDWELVNGTAQSGSDFGGATSGTLQFDQDNLTLAVTVPITDDTEIEAAEDFQFALTSVFAFFLDESSLDVAIQNATSTVTIEDDDGPGEVVFSNELYQVGEGDEVATITLSRQGGSNGTLTGFYRTEAGTATAGDDYESVNGSVTWEDGDVADKTFTVPILDDAEVEGGETVVLTAADNNDYVGAVEATLNINDDDGQSEASFAAADISAGVSEGGAVLTLVRSGSTTGAVSVDYATEDGTAVAGEDYVAAAGTVTWEDGDGADKTIEIEFIEDSEDEAESFSVNLSNVTGPAALGSTAVVTVTIEADLARNIAEIPTLTPNQRELAEWFDDTCPRLGESDVLNPDQQDLAGICTTLRGIDSGDDEVREALDAINPEELLVTTVNALRLTAVQHGNLSQRLNALRSGASGVDLAGLQLEVQGQQIAGAALQEMFDGLVGGGASADGSMAGRWGAFVNGRIATGDKDKTDNEAGFDFDLYSITLGVDYRIKPNLIVGVSAGTGSVATDYDADGGELDIDSWNGAAYLTYFREQSFYFDALATYGKNEYDSKRHIVFGSGAGLVDRVGRGDTDGKQFSFGFGSGWDFNRGGVVFGPHFGGYYYDVKVDGFAETGASGLNVAIEDQSTQSKTLNAGAHVSYAWLTDWGVLIPNAKADWVHEFEDNRETLAFQFVNDPFAGDPSDPSPSITLQTDRPDPNYMIWSVGVSAQFIYGLSGFVNYQSYAGYRDVTVSEWSFGGRWEKMF